jgi:transposase-like protein
MNALLPTPEELTLTEVLSRFNTEEKAVDYLEAVLWPNGPVCPHCSNKDESKMWKLSSNKAAKIRVGLRQCAACNKQFRVTVGTIFEDSHIPLHLWVVAWYLMCGAKKGMSAMQMKRHLGLGSYKSAWFMCHRIRHAMQDLMPKAQMTGTVEVDECYVGPKGTADKPRQKSAVIALVHRETGERRSVVVDRITANDLKAAIVENVSREATVNTDESMLYRNIPKSYRHKTNFHQPKKGNKPRYHYVDKKTGETVTTNYVESSFSLLRRGVYGSFHHISRKHLALYVAEFDYRWNSRKDTDGERTVSGIAKAKGKRMTLLKPLQKGAKPADPKLAPRKPRAKVDPIIPAPPQWWTDKNKH